MGFPTDDDAALPRRIEAEVERWAAARELRPGHREAVYVSQPITSGRAFVDWLAGRGAELEAGTPEHDESFRAGVMLTNFQRAAGFVETLRWREGCAVIDPSSLDVPGFEQADYHRFWVAVLERFVRRVVFLDGWEHSNGCCIEYRTACEIGLECVDERFGDLPLELGIERVETALEETQQRGLEIDTHSRREVLAALRALASGPSEARFDAGEGAGLFKDAVLHKLAETENVAQFVSFGPGPDTPQRFRRLAGDPGARTFESVEAAAEAVIARSAVGRANIRSFDPQRSQGNPFLTDFTSAAEVAREVRRLAGEHGLYTIVNETIDIHDGGVSGVMHQGWIDFAPDATPRCVDDPAVETCALPQALGLKLLTSVYGPQPLLLGRTGSRVEFSVHPYHCGLHDDSTVIWQQEQRPGDSIEARIRWPNAYSRFLGDKVFGLLLADAAGLHVPRTLVTHPRLFPFVFGALTGSRETITRTSPSEKEPGFYPTRTGWFDPRAVLTDVWSIAEEGPQPMDGRSPLAAVLSQEAVQARWAGRALLRAGQRVEAEGVPGSGDDFMLGKQAPEPLPRDVHQRLASAYEALPKSLGDVSVEWVDDGRQVWTVQLNQLRHTLQGQASTADEWIPFDPRTGGIEAFRALVQELRGSRRGLHVQGSISPLSHYGEIAQLEGVPVRFGDRND